MSGSESNVTSHKKIDVSRHFYVKDYVIEQSGQE